MRTAMSMRSISTLGPGARQGAPVGDPLEEHYSLQEIAQKWGVDYETARKEFIDRDGVLVLGDQDRKDGKRAYCTIRVPKSLLERAYRERTTRKFHATRKPIATARRDTRSPEDSSFPRRARRRFPPDKQKTGKS